MKRCLLMRGASEVRIERSPSVLERPFMFAIGGAIFAGHDPAEFPGVAALFPTSEPVARAKFDSLESLLVAASTDETRKSFCAVFFQLCRNLAVATNGHVLHTAEILSGDEGDFLVPRRAIELVENIRKATKSDEVEASFFEHQVVLRVDRFEIASRLETEKFPAWEEVIPRKSEFELCLSKRGLLKALDHIGAAIGNRSSGVCLRRVTEGLEIHSGNPDGGEMTTTIDASSWEDGAAIGVNLTYLYNAARFALSDELRIGITDEESPLVIKDGPYAAYVMPMRLEGAKR
jgi:DNA polymerase-3 subunit beta